MSRTLSKALRRSIVCLGRCSSPRGRLQVVSECTPCQLAWRCPLSIGGPLERIAQLWIESRCYEFKTDSPDVQTRLGLTVSATLLAVKSVSNHENGRSPSSGRSGEESSGG